MQRLNLAGVNFRQHGIRKAHEDRKYLLLMIKLIRSTGVGQYENHTRLDRCRDRGIEGFDRYIAWGVVGFNLHKLGAILLEREQRARSLR